MSNLHEERFVGIEATQALVAKVKKGDTENAEAIQSLADNTYTKQETEDRINDAISDHLHHDETLVGTGSANDPLGVNPETIEDNVLRMRYRGGGRLKFWRTNPLPTT